MAHRTARTLSPLAVVFASGCLGGVLLFVAPTQTSKEPSLRGSAGQRGETKYDHVSGNSSGVGGFCCFAAVSAVCAAVARASKAGSSMIARRAEPVSAAAAAAAAAKGAAAAKAASAAGAKAAGGAIGIGAGTGKSVDKSGNASQNNIFDPSTQVGVTDPLGFFDPAGFCKKGDEPGFRNLRAAELKHGRVAMMAALGAVVQHYVQFPGFTAVPKGLGAVVTAPGEYGFAALFAASGALELGVWTESPSKEPGNFGDPAGLGQYTTEMRNRELNNGRMAMFAALGIVAAELLTGKDGVEQFGF